MLVLPTCQSYECYFQDHNCCLSGCNLVCWSHLFVTHWNACWLYTKSMIVFESSFWYWPSLLAGCWPWCCLTWKRRARSGSWPLEGAGGSPENSLSSLFVSLSFWCPLEIPAGSSKSRQNVWSPPGPAGRTAAANQPRTPIETPRKIYAKPLCVSDSNIV